MENEKLPCDAHTEQIKTLFKEVDSVKNKLEKIEDEREFMYKLDKNMAIQTEMLKSIVEHNKRQDARMDKQDKRMDEQHEVIVNINTNLTELNEGQKTLNKRVGKLEEKVDENEKKNKIDLRDIIKQFFIKYALPIGFVVGIIELIRKYMG